MEREGTDLKQHSYFTCDLCLTNQKILQERYQEHARRMLERMARKARGETVEGEGVDGGEDGEGERGDPMDVEG